MDGRPKSNYWFRNGLYKCKKCPYSSKEARDLVFHVKSHEVKEEKDHVTANVKVDPTNYVGVSVQTAPNMNQANRRPLTNISCRDGLLTFKKCSYSSQEAGTLREHIKLHGQVAPNVNMVEDKNRKLCCDFCNQLFADTYKLHRHRRSVHFKIPEHKCDTCDYAGSRMEHLKKHHKISAHGMLANSLFVNVDVDVDPLTITVPNESPEGEEHKKEVHSEVKECKIFLNKLQVHRCDICGLSFVQKSSLFKHKYIIHFKIKKCKVLLTKINSKNEKYERNSNDTPKQTEGRLLRARDHRIKYVETEVEMEEEAERKFKEERGREQRAREIPEQKEEKIQKKGDNTARMAKKIEIVHAKDSPCPECGFLFSTGDNLEIHLRNIHPEYFEESVSNEFVNQRNRDHKDYDLHGDVVDLDVNGYVKVWKCDICDYSFFKRHDLKSHVKTVHNGIKYFKCDLCGYTSIQKRDLKVHKKAVHYKIKDCICDICEEAFSHSQTLNRHKRTVHDKVKDYICNLCEYAVSTKLMLTLHKINAHGEEKNIQYFQCEICGYKSYEKRKVDIHRRAVHDKIRSYICNICKKTFSHSQNLNRHKNAKHSENVTRQGKVEDDEVIASGNEVISDKPKASIDKSIEEWVCDMCGFAAGQKSGLIEHVHNIHWKGKATGSGNEKLKEHVSNAENTAPWEELITSDTHYFDHDPW